jgi:Flp pilus assembly secretin CpaC
MVGSSWDISGRATAQEVGREMPSTSPIVREVSPRDVRERPLASGEADSADNLARAAVTSGDIPSQTSVALANAAMQPQSSAVTASENSTVMVMVDHAKVVRLPDRTQTVIVGNPMVADITIQRNGIIVVTGKSYGATNLIALDAAGLLLAESTISVQAPTDAIVTVQRGLARESYSCTPTCQPSLRLGDSQDYFGAVGNQTTQRNTLATQR